MFNRVERRKWNGFRQSKIPIPMRTLDGVGKQLTVCVSPVQIQTTKKITLKKRYRQVRWVLFVLWRDFGWKRKKYLCQTQRSLDGAWGKMTFLQVFLERFPWAFPYRWGRASLAGAFVLGMGSMMFVSTHFGKEVSADQRAEISTSAVVAEQQSVDTFVTDEHVLSDEDIQDFSELMNNFETDGQFEKRLREMTDGYPIERMTPFILKQDRMVAIFLVSIAKKESNWGKRVPVLSGQDCFNYWGYRLKRPLMGTGGHTCFNSREDAVNSVAKRIKKLIEQEQLNTPEKMIVWKCGYSCEGHSRESVRKWISDVDMYFSTLNQAVADEEGSFTKQNQKDIK